jgi:uncharacterized membrane protein (UPF0127 family)
MFKQKLKYLPAALAGLAGLLAIILAFTPEQGISAGMTKGELLVEGASHPPQRFIVEVAVTHDQLERGLMYRDSIAADYGMLFMFGPPKEEGMWMKNTRIALDMLFIDGAGVVKTIHENARPYDETPIMSGAPVVAVLEIAGGQVAARGIKTGDHVTAKPYLPQP